MSQPAVMTSDMNLWEPLMQNIPCCILSWCTAAHIFNKNHPAFWSFSGGGELGRTKTFAITSDLAKVVMEMPVAGSKATKDSEVSTLRQIFHEMEEEDVVDSSLNGHEVDRAPACGDNASSADSVGPSLFLVALCF